MIFLLGDFNVSPSCKTSAPTNYPQNLHPHEPCLCCFNPYHSSSDYPSWGQFFNFSYEQMSTNFSNQGFESHSNCSDPNYKLGVKGLVGRINLGFGSLRMQKRQFGLLARCIIGLMDVRCCL